MNDSRGGGLSVETQVLAALSYMASNSFQLVVGDVLGISRQSASRCIYRVAAALVEKRGQFIYFPSSEEDLNRVSNGFYAIAGFPNVIGVVDCTHIRILAPDSERDYVNRKNQHSVNVQAICDHKGRFLNIVAKWPGSTHDSFIIRHSLVWDVFESHARRGYILGDSGYAGLRWLLTPFAAPNTEARRRYRRFFAPVKPYYLTPIRFNSAHDRTRVIIEDVLAGGSDAFIVFIQK